jgi:prolyl-tRNA synthetase
MYDAYHRIFERCCLSFRPVEAHAGEIGGDVNHEFMAVAAVGEDDFVWCTACDYAANVEAAVRQAAAGSPPPADAPPMTRIHTPDLPNIDGVAKLLGADPSTLLKCIAFDVGGELGVALVPGDREVNEFALGRALAGKAVRLLTEDDFDARPDLPKGYIGPHHPAVSVVVADHAIAAGGEWVTGANEVDHHVEHAVLGRDFDVDVWADLVVVRSGDPCPRCGSPLSVDRGIEVGHVFQIGSKYSDALGALYTDESGASHPMLMGCYGVGVSRIVAAVVEEHHDEHGIAWPAAVAPYDVHLVALPGKGDAAARVTAEAERIYAGLVERGVSVLFDDRDASPGVKFADADLLGMPVQLVVGAKGLDRGVVERKVRATGERDELLVADVVESWSAGAGT